MTDTTTEPKRIPIPKNVTDREFWLDCFASFAQVLIQAYYEHVDMLHIDRPSEQESLDGCVRMAAHVADTALEEALFRQWVTAGAKRKRSTGRKRK